MAPRTPGFLRERGLPGASGARGKGGIAYRLFRKRLLAPHTAIKAIPVRTK